MDLIINKIILVLFCSMPVCEFINGMFLGKHVSDIYRIVLLFFILLYLFYSKNQIYKQSFQMLGVVIFFILLTFFQFSILHGEILVLKSDLKTIFRILLAPLYYAYFYKCLHEGDITKKTLEKILILYSFLYASLIVIPSFFNFGLATYDIQGSGFLHANEGIGFKGYFVEINSLVAILIACMVYTGEFSLLDIKEDNLRTGIYKMIITFGLMYALIITSTKTGMLATIIYLLVFLIKILKNDEIQRTIRQIIFVVITILVIAVPLMSNSLQEQWQGFMDRASYFYNLFNGNLLKFLTSNRSTFLNETARAAFTSKYWCFFHFFGGGYFINLHAPYDPFRRVVIEMDWYDFYFSYGIVGIIVYLNYFKDSIFNFFGKNKTPISFMLIIFIVYSIIAGHVIYNSMTATFIAIILGYFTNSNLEENYE
ncbi:O-antigen ligase family protein [Enterococcus hirae]